MTPEEAALRKIRQVISRQRELYGAVDAVLQEIDMIAFIAVDGTSRLLTPKFTKDTSELIVEKERSHFCHTPLGDQAVTVTQKEVHHGDERTS